MRWNNKKIEEEYMTKDFVEEIEKHLASKTPIERIRVKVSNQFHQYKRGDDLIVDNSAFTKALIKNGTFVRVEGI